MRVLFQRGLDFYCTVVESVIYDNVDRILYFYEQSDEDPSYEIHDISDIQAESILKTLLHYGFYNLCFYSVIVHFE